VKKLLARFFFFVAGWKPDADPALIERARHSVMVAAPHTSNWDFPFAILGFWYIGLDMKYFIKDSYTKSILGWFFTWTGALGVDRSKQNNLVEHTVNLLKTNRNLVILVPAEGTRKRVEKWRKGFYTIATEAGVPISLGYLDFKLKMAGIGQIFEPTGNFEADMQVIQEFYQTKTGKHPELYNPQIF
jgi:1-acyl-sn-glycerol-3-phosphate acyltransferase